MRWARSWILCAAFYYPALWLAASCVWALPGLSRSALFGEQIVDLRVTALGMVVISAPTNPAAHPIASHSSFNPVSSLWLLIPLALAIGIGLTGAGRIRRILSGLAVIVLTDFALVFPLARFPALRITVPVVLNCIFFFALLCLGFSWMSSGWADSTYWPRLAGLWAGTVLPPLALWAVFRSAPPFALQQNVFWMLAPPAALAASVACLRPSRTPLNDASPALTRAIGYGIALTILLAAGAAWGGPMITHAIEIHEERANQAAVSNLPPIPLDAPYPKIFFQKGVSFSAEFPDPYASAGARQMLTALRADGVNAVALVPYGGMQLGSPEVRSFGRHSWESEEGLRELSRLAHALGMKVMLKPGIWVRGGHFGGDIEFSIEADRQKWFREYAQFIESYAKIATEIHADIFCIGGEFVRMSSYEDEWRRIIANVRTIYPGPLTYAANFGDEFQDLKFWDALDYIGLQEYYPLPDNLSTDAVVAKVEAIQHRFNKPVIFTEVGFPSTPGANRHPWEDGKPGAVDLQLQARCYQAILQAFYGKPWFEGMYWWKVGTNGSGGPADSSLTPWNKPAMAVVRRWYENGSRKDAGLSKSKSEKRQAAP